MKYIAHRADGTDTIHVNREALNRAIDRSEGTRTIVDYHRADDPPPTNSDARAWDAWNDRRGYHPGR